MYHQHFDQIPSTQTYLKDHFADLQKKDTHLLISCDQQTTGHGRNNKTWDDSFGSIAFSFTYDAKKTPTLIPLFIALKITEYFKVHANLDLQVKWPNDLYYLNKKCGGIICHKIDEMIIAGVGLNVMSSPLVITDNNNIVGHLGLSLEKDFKKDLPHEIYQHILKSDFEELKIINEFQQVSLYLKEAVVITEDDKTYSGIFLGIGELGEAIIKKDNGELIKIYNGTLRKVSS